MHLSTECGLSHQNITTFLTPIPRPMYPPAINLHVHKKIANDQGECLDRNFHLAENGQGD